MNNLDPIRADYENYLRGIVQLPYFASFAKDSSTFRNPACTAQDLREFVDDITYKKINDWDSKGLISGKREKAGSGWRKFSFIDLIKFRIISDLRDIGLDIKSIGLIINKLDSYALTISKGSIKVRHMEFSMSACLKKAKIVLLIDHTRTPYFFTEHRAVKTHFLINSNRPLIFLPFYTYIADSWGTNLDLFTRNKTSIQPLLAISEKEIDIIRLIRRQDYKEIIVRKEDGNKFHIKIHSQTSGKFTEADVIDALRECSYQSIRITLRDNQVLTIDQEKNLKL